MTSISEEIVLRPRKVKSSLSKDLLKENIQINEFNNFKKNLTALISQTEKSSSNAQGEENVKNIFIEFLKDSFYKDKNFINTMSYKGRNEADLVIHAENNQDSNVSVIFEVKTQKNKTEMLSKDIIEKKSPSELLKNSFYEAVLYFFHEVIGKNNIELKNIIITNVFEYFIFDAKEFKRVFLDRNRTLLNIFDKWKKRDQLIDGKTNTFYDQVKIYITDHPEYLNNLRFTYFDIREFKTDEDLKLLFKIFSPKHLLKQASANDSNILNKEFYNELLHIIGLEEVKKGSQKLIQRKKQTESGSLIENTIRYINENEKIDNIIDKSYFGKNKDEIIFNVSLSLCIRWINRILFLKLLEGQLFNYHNGDKSYRFLDFTKVKTFKRLNRLFFSVLAKKNNERDEITQEEFFRVPYLNSSLFESSEIEKQVLEISALEDDLRLSLYKNTVLKDEKTKKLKGSLTTLEYLLNFLNSYDFGADSTTNNELSEESKTLINASVLGLIFEKINGYKDGSFYTPSFITAYMAKETIYKTIILKFNEKYNWDCQSIEDLEFFIFKKKIDLQEANNLVDSIKICDPAVGSGHFLVSALNEIIAIKSKLSILCDENWNRLLLQIENKNDELEIRTKDDEIFEYKVKSHSNYMPVNREIIQESTRIQKALFIQKKNLIENSLFGVDINNNSVMICSLRLWIELLKNTFYTEESNYTELETLPNIDINIKQGNSLISRYDLDVNLSTVFTKSGFSVKEYRDNVKKYKETNSKDEKKKVLNYIKSIKKQFKTEIDKKFEAKVIDGRKKIKDLNQELKQSSGLIISDELIKKEILITKKELDNKLNKAILNLSNLEKELNEINSSAVYKDAFEWRFEFPEVLNENGDFIGFDIIIGNPPYISNKDMQNRGMKNLITKINQSYESSVSGNYDIYIIFIELSLKLSKNKAFTSLIIPNKFLIAKYSKRMLNLICEKYNFMYIIDLSKFKVFLEASIYPIVISIQNKHINKNNVIRYESIKSNEIVLDTGLEWNYLDAKPIYEFKDNKSRIMQKIESKKINNLDISFEPGINGFQFTNYSNCITEGNKNIKNPAKRLVVTGNIDRYTLLDNETKYKGVKYKKPYIFYNSEIISEGKWKLFSAPKILVAGMTKIIEATLDEFGEFAPSVSVYSIVASVVDLKCYLAQLNSKMINWYFNLKFQDKHLQGGYISINNLLLKQIPLFLPELEIKNNLINLVDEISEKKKQKVDTKDLEKQIDKIVYELYDLTEEEIDIIENG